MFIFVFLLIGNNLKNQKINKICIFLGLLLPCIIAGLRNYSVGTDIKVYLLPLYNEAHNFNQYFMYIKSTIITGYNNSVVYVSSYDYGFTFLVYLIARTVNNFQFLLLTIEATIIFPMYFGSKKIFHDNKSIAMFILVYLFFFYAIGLNAMRQMMSLSIFFYGFCCYFSKSNKYKISLIVSIILSIAFHKTAVLYIFIVASYKIFECFKGKKISYKKEKFKINGIILVVFLSFILSFIIDFYMLDDLLSSIGLNHYAYYLYGKSLGIPGLFIFKIPLYYLISVLLKKCLNKSNEEEKYFIILLLANEIFATILYHVNIYAIRIGYVSQLLLLMYVCNYFPKISKSIQKTSLLRKIKFNKAKFINLMFYAYLFIYWFYYTVICGSNQVIPYYLFVRF